MASAATGENAVSEEERVRRHQREREEAMEQMMLQQEAAAMDDDDRHLVGGNDNNDQNNEANHAHEDPPVAGRRPQDNEQAPEQQEMVPAVGEDAPLLVQEPHTATHQAVAQKVSYRQGSFFAAAALLFYAFRTRQQYYLAAVFLSSSKWAYVILGNALVAAAISTFDFVTGLFLQGLRLQEAEGLQDFFRWNVTETCLALTMFRSELHLYTAVEFLLLILVKCLHQVAIFREQHVRMTEDAIVPWQPQMQQQQQQQQQQHPGTGDQVDVRQQQGMGADVVDTESTAWPVLRSGHIRLLAFLLLLQLLDLWAAQYTVQHIIANGPSVNILFAFEAAILLVSAWSHLLLWNLNVMDSILQYGHEHAHTPRYHSAFRRVLHPWKEYKATLIFAVELQAQAVQFMFYLTFFSIVLTYYGMPINLFREVYISFAALKERLLAFFTYRQLMASMNRFQNPTEEELQETGTVCIICRDEMTVHDCKRLPVCKHIFHKSCLREWLVQQQSCPTCRSDIASMQAQEDAATAAEQRAAVAQLMQLQQENRQREAQNQDNGGGVEQQAEASPQGELTTAPTTVEPPNLQDEEPVSRGIGGGDTSSTIKRVRFKVVETTGVATNRHFPAIYKVERPGGAPVFRDGDETTSFRKIPQGSLLLCQGVKHSMQQQPEGQGQTPFLQIPDGWVPEDALTHVLTIATFKK